METKKISCREMVDLLVDYLDGKLSRETTKELQEHLSGCSPCISFINTYRKTITLSQKLKCESIPPELQRRLRDFLREKVR